MSSQSGTAPTQGRGLLARLFRGLIGRVRRLFRKEPADNPNIYPFF